MGTSTSGASATRDGIRFRWQAPAVCPEESEVQAAIERRLGGPIGAREAPRITIIVDVRQQPDSQFGVNVWTVDDDGLHQRELTDADCQSIANAVALVAAMAIDVRIQEEANEDSDGARVARKLRDVEQVSPPPSALAPSPPNPPPPEPVTPARTPSVRTKPRGALRLAAGVIYGDLPAAGAQIRMTPALLLPRWRLELEVTYGPARKLSLSTGEQARLQLVAGSLRACPLLRAGRVEFPLCLGVEVGRMSAHGKTALPRANWDTWVALQLSGGVAVVVHRRVALLIALEGAAYLKRSVIYEDSNPARPTGRLAVRALAGIEFRFP